MIDYLRMIFDNPRNFCEEYSKNPDILNFNSRREDAYGGTILHLIIRELMMPSINREFNDRDALMLTSFMFDNGACLLIENSGSRIPYELFNIYVENPFRFETYRFLLSRTCDMLMEGKCNREFYEDYINPVVNYDFDRAYI